jgi:ribosomal RNA-processing protein 17
MGKGGGGKQASGNRNKRKRPVKNKFKRREKLIVTFDAAERKEYLTGFHKRKVQRRLDAIEQLKQQERQDRIRERAERRDAEQERIDSNRAARRSNVTSYNIPAPSMPSDKKEEYEDDFTKKAFGQDSVTVTTTFGLGNSSDEEEDQPENFLTPSEMKKKEKRDAEERSKVREQKKNRGNNSTKKTGNGRANNMSSLKRRKMLQHLAGHGKKGHTKGKQRGSTAKRVNGRSKHSRAGKKFRK